MRRLLVVIAAGVPMLVLASIAASQVEPPSVEVTLGPGESLQVVKTVSVPEAPPRADIYFLADTTGSMGPVLTAVRADAAAILAALSGLIGDVQFGAGQYQDFPSDPFAFRNGAPIGPDDGVGGNPDASDEIASWFPGGGGDFPEAQLFALDQIADPADPAGIGWRSGTTHIVVWFGDAPGHDPVCAAISGLGYDITEASATAKLVANGVTVVAINTPTAFGGPLALDGDPTVGAWDYSPPCTIGGASGQASRIGPATGGVTLVGVTPDEIAQAIVDAIGELMLDITAMPVGCEPLEIDFEPPVIEDVAGPATVEFEETISVPGDLEPDDVPEGFICCTVEFKASGSVIGEQEVCVNFNTPPVAACVESVNPAGKKIPPAGNTTLPGPKGGQNEDGFYQLIGEDEQDGTADVFVTNASGSVVFGPFASGTVVKITEAPGATPSSKPMGGPDSAVAAHIKLDSDAFVFAVDSFGEVSPSVGCLAPPLPK